MDTKIIPNSLFNELKKQGYSDEAIKELSKWYNSSKKKEVMNYNNSFFFRFLKKIGFLQVIFEVFD